MLLLDEMFRSPESRAVRRGWGNNEIVTSEKHQEPQFDTVEVKSKQKLVTLKNFLLIAYKEEMCSSPDHCWQSLSA